MKGTRRNRQSVEAEDLQGDRSPNQALAAASSRPPDWARLAVERSSLDLHSPFLTQ